MPQAACKALAPRHMPSRHMSVSRSDAHGSIRGRQNGSHIRVILVAVGTHVRCGSLTAADGAADRRRHSSHTPAAAAPCLCSKPSAAPPSTKHHRFLQAQSSRVSFTPPRAAAPPLAAENTKVRRSRQTVMSLGFPHTRAAPISGRLPRCCQKHTKSAGSHSATMPLIFMGFLAPYAKAPPHAHTQSSYILAAPHTRPQPPHICIPSMPTPCPPRPARGCGRPTQAHPVAGTERRTYSHTSPVTAPASRHLRCLVPASGFHCTGYCPQCAVLTVRRPVPGYDAQCGGPGGPADAGVNVGGSDAQQRRCPRGLTVPGQ